MEKLNNLVADFMQPYKERTAKGKDFCEQACAKYLESRKDICFQKFGFDETNNKIPSKWFFQIPKVIRNCPDFIVIGESVSFIECKGCKGELKVKLDDLGSYEFWNEICQLYFFVLYKNGDQEKRKIISYTKLMFLIGNEKPGTDFYPDNGKEYYKIPFDTL